ncbi:MAG: hypothetical protein K2M98_02700 [Muribaculum sp.]|nr:hypothetical protein [Muribaculum sp.]
MSEITEEALYDAINRARNPMNIDARMTILNESFYYSQKLTGYTLRAIYRLVLYDFEKLLGANAMIATAVAPDLECFKKTPGLKTLHALISSITEFCRARSPQAFFAINDKIGCIFKHICANLDQILGEKFPGLSHLRAPETMAIIDSSREARAKNDFISFGSFIKTLSANGPSIKFNDMMDEYTASCITSDNLDFVKSYLDQQYYTCEDFTVCRRKYFDDYRNIDYTAIIPQLKPYSVLDSPVLTVPVTKNNTYLEYNVLQVPSQYNFFVANEDVDGRSVFIEYQNDGTKTIKFLNGIVAGIAMAMGRENLEVVIEDPLNKGITWEVESIIPPSRLTTCKTESRVTDSLEALAQFVEIRIQRLGNYMRNIRKKGTVDENLLVAIFVNPNQLNDAETEIYRNIVARGYRAGVLVVSLMPSADINSTAMRNSLRFILSEHCSLHYEFDSMTLGGIMQSTDKWFENWLRNAPELSDKWSRNLGKALEEDTEDIIDELENGFASLTDSKLVTTIGLSDDSEFNFNFDTTAHTHAFIMGKTGSGKSVLLHNIIVGLINTYSPVDLQLYLLDFKLGGVEFNRYRNVKHLRSLLVDNSDFQIVLEIMRDIDKQMKLRGKALRDVGCNNITDYNRQQTDNPMPQIVIVIDECHQIFNTHSSGNAKMQAEITGVLTKIAKEGRNQGVHMIFATQTLAGADIPSDILNNVTDYYLMNCAPADSERLVNGSSKFTTGLSVGRVYYHHVEYNKVFQGNYVSNEKSCEVVNKIVQKSDSYTGNGQLYFNGSQEYSMIENIPESKDTSKDIDVICGKTVDLERRNLKITLPNDYGENILVCGLNKGDNTDRATVIPILSLLLNRIKNQFDYRIIVLNSSRNSGESIRLLEHLHSLGYIKYITGDKRPVLSSLAQEIITDCVPQSTLLCILGQEQMRELKMNMPLVDVMEKNEDTDASDKDSIFNGLDFGISKNTDSKPDTTQKALEIIIDKGPNVGVHTIMQIDKIDRFLFDDYPSAKMIFSKFKHLILLRSDEKTSGTLHLADDCRPERLSDDEERLRAIYYNDDLDTYTLFTPFTVPDTEDIDIFINDKQ